MSDLPRLLLCTFDVLPGPSGQSRRLSEYLRGLSDHFHVVVLTVKTPDHPHIEKFQGARLLRVPVGAGDLTARVQAFDRAVRRQLESEEYSVVHFTDPFGGYALCESRDQHDYKIVYDAQTFPSQELRFTHPQLEGDRRFLARVRRQELFCLMNADRVLTGSKVTRDFIHSLGVAPELVEVIRQPVDLEPFAAEPAPPPTGSPMRLLYLGSQVGWQGLPMLLRGMAQAVRKVDLRLTIIGPPHSAWQPLLEDLVRELELDGKVEFQPPVPHADLHKVVGASDVGVIPLDQLDRNEVQGGPVAKAAEYLAAGRPIVASDLPVTRELLPEAATRFHAPGDPEDLGDCLVELAENPELRKRLGAAALEEAKRIHDGGKIRARILEVYREIARLAPAPRLGDGQEAPSSVGTPTGRLALVGRPRGDDPGDQPGTDPAVHPEALRAGGSRQRLSARHGQSEKPRRRGARSDDSDPAIPPPTDPAIQQRETPRGVMGTLLPEAERERSGAGTDPAVPPPAPPQVAGASLPPPPASLARPPPPADPEAPVFESAGSPLPPPPLPRTGPRLVEPPADDAPEEISADEVEEHEGEDGEEDVPSADDDAEAIDDDQDQAQASTRPEQVESADDAVLEASDDQPYDAAEASRLDPWLALLVHGWCPPGGAQFARPTPPTNFPGRDGPPPPTVASLPRPSGEG